MKKKSSIEDSQTTVQVKPNQILSAKKVRGTIDQMRDETQIHFVGVHRTFEFNVEGKREPVWYVCDVDKVTRLSGSKIEKFIAASSGHTIRFSQVNSNDLFLLELERVGATTHFAHWHALGIEKNAEPEAIAAALFNAPANRFRVWTPRHDIVALRQALSLSMAVTEFHKAATLKFKQVGRDMGLPSGTKFAPEEAEWLDGLRDSFTVAIDGKEVKLDKNVERIAKTIPECVLFNEVAGIKGGFGIASQVVAFTGGIDRFDSVAALWKYCGQHVVDGKSPRRQKGKPSDWSTRLRCTLYNLVEMAINRHRENPWYAVLEEYRKLEAERHAALADHACKYPETHIERRARRRVTKDILREFFVRAKGLNFDNRQKMLETHVSRAEVDGGSVRRQVGHETHENSAAFGASA